VTRPAQQREARAAPEFKFVRVKVGEAATPINQIASAFHRSADALTVAAALVTVGPSTVTVSGMVLASCCNAKG